MDYTKKNKILFIGGVLACFIIVMTLVIPVVKLNNNCSDLSLRIQNALQASKNAEELKNKINATDKFLLSKKDTVLDSQQQVLETVSLFCNSNNTLLKEFPKTVFTKNGDYMLETHIFTVEGNYPQLLNLAYELEYKKKLGRIASLDFKTKTDLKTQRKNLLATIYLQTIKKTS